LKKEYDCNTDTPPFSLDAFDECFQYKNTLEEQQLTEMKQSLLEDAKVLQNDIMQTYKNIIKNSLLLKYVSLFMINSDNLGEALEELLRRQQIKQE
jgi:hypothetical protein